MINLNIIQKNNEKVVEIEENKDENYFKFTYDGLEHYLKRNKTENAFCTSCFFINFPVMCSEVCTMDYNYVEIEYYETLFGDIDV